MARGSALGELILAIGVAYPRLEVSSCYPITYEQPPKICSRMDSKTSDDPLGFIL